jgi:small subunit ribosomal protein S1
MIHISDLSWTRKYGHPSEALQKGQEVKCVVLEVNEEKQRISLGMKQIEPNPWELAARKYPPGTIVTAHVRSMTNFGAFVEIEPGIDGMIHISDLSWTRKYGHPSEALQKGQEVKCVVLEVNQEKQRISLGMKQMTEDPWIHAIPEKYIPGQIIKGKIAKLTNFGAFVELEPELEGLLHISELADHKIDKPQDVVKPGDDVEVKILKVDPEARKIGLSLRRVQWAAAPAEEHAAPAAAPKKAPKYQTAPQVDAGGDTLRVKEALQRRAQAKAAESQPQESTDEPKPEEGQAAGG